MKYERMKPPEMVLYVPRKIGIVVCKNLHRRGVKLRVHIAYLIAPDGKIFDDPKPDFVINYLYQHEHLHPREVIERECLHCSRVRSKKYLPKPPSL